MNNTAFRKLTILSSLFLVIFAMLASCAGLGVGRKTDQANDTEKTADVESLGRYKWPSELLPGGFPVLCEEVADVTRDEEGVLIIAVRDPSWREMKEFVNSLISDGWGSVEAGYAAIVRNSEKKNGEKQMTDAQLLRAVLSLSVEFEGYTDENQKSLSYYGQKNGKSVLCVLDTLQRANENRFVMYVNDLPEASYQSFPEPGCRVKIDNGWTAMVENGQLYVGYDYDPSGNCMCSLSSGSGNPGDLMEEYFEYLSSLYGGSVTAERKDEVLTVAGGSDVSAASFTLHGMPADLFCMYASWKTKDGRTWQMTVSAYSYDLPTVRFVVGRMLEDIVFGLPAG